MIDSLLLISDSELETTLDKSQLSLQQNITTTNYKDSIYNNSNYKLTEPSNIGIYIFDNSLFNRTLSNIDFSKKREVLIKCLTCNFTKITILKGF
jgi:hypothetical protein